MILNYLLEGVVKKLRCRVVIRMLLRGQRDFAEARASCPLDDHILQNFFFSFLYLLSLLKTMSKSHKQCA